MRAVSIELSESARSDLAAMVSWYETQGAPEVGERFVAEILARVEDLGNHPDLGRVVPEFNQPLLRELIHTPFRIIYRHEQNMIFVVRIWRHERLLLLRSYEETQ